MPHVAAPLYSLNGGEVGKEALGRLDLERLQFAGSLYSNMLPRVIGSMTLRPGLEHVCDLDIGDVTLLEYAYSGSSVLLPILSDEEMRILKDDALVSRASVSTAITNGDFAAFTGWTDASAGSASAAVSSGELVLSGTTQDRASATQTISVASGDRNVEHGLRIEVTRGPVNVRLGSTSGATDLLPNGKDAVLDDGTHSIAFTPTTASIYLELFSDASRPIHVASCKIDDDGTLVLPTPWTDDDLGDDIVRYRQSLDVVYVASGIYQQRMIQRRSDTGWGIQRYKVDDGPFVTSDGSLSLTPSALTGQITLTANKNYFSSEMAGRLFRLVQNGQSVTEVFSDDPAEGDYVRISGVGSARKVTYTITGTWSGTLRLQVALDDGSGSPASWTDRNTFSGNDSGAFTDDDNNVIKFFRFALDDNDLISGTVTATLSYDGGSRSGIVRLLSVASATSGTAEVVSRLYATGASFIWDYSTWSDYDGWPGALELWGGRLYWFLAGKGYGSIPDVYDSFDDTVEGDSAPIVRSINANAQRGALWALGMQRLIVGTDISEISVKASAIDDPLTASAWFPADASTRGCANIRAVKADKDGIFVQASKTALFRLALGDSGYDYTSTDLTDVHEKICDGSPIVDIAVQRRPDTIVWLVLDNGEARALTYEPSEKVVAWSRVVTDGTFSRVAVSRGAGDDAVFFVVTRNETQRLERMASLTDCRGGNINCLADGFTRFDLDTAATTFSVPQLDGLDVMVWADGKAIHDQDSLYTVSDGTVTLTTAAKQVVIGLPYTGKWQSTKLAYGAKGGTALMRRKRVAELGLYLVDTMLDGLRVGHDFDHLHRFAVAKGGKAIPDGTLYEDFDADLMSISSNWSTDSRVCVEAKAPYPCTLAAMVLDTVTNG